jgi:hypothetical protein
VEFVLLIAGSLAFVLAMRWAIRKVAFRFMRFAVPARGKTYIYHRERFTDAVGHRVTDPVLLAELKEAWRAIELQTANDVARIESGNL